MNLDEAVSVAQRMKNTFRAFEFLEEFLELARAKDSQSANIDQDVKILTNKKLVLEDTIKDLEDLHRNMVDKINGIQAELKTTEDEVNKRKEEYQKQLDADMVEMGRQAAEKKATLDKEMASIIDEHKKTLEKMAEEKQSKEDILSKLNEKMKVAKSQMAKAAEQL